MPLPLSDDDLLLALRGECARMEGPQRPAVLGGPGEEGEDAVARLFELRDEALGRGLPLPANCPTERIPH
jgi:hypothetical protein